MKKSVKLTRIQEKRAQLEILQQLFDRLKSIEQDCLQSYERVGEEQATDWRTGELKWEDEEKTVPKMTGKYEYIPKSVEDMDDDEYAKYLAVDHIRTILEKLI